MVPSGNSPVIGFPFQEELLAPVGDKRHDIFQRFHYQTDSLPSQ